MTNKKNTRRALYVSALSLILCFAMLMGTTYAWFTDSVSNNNNIIKSGSLDVEMMWAKGTEVPASAGWADASVGSIFDYQKWEPGYTEARHIKVVNKGTLALNWNLSIAATDAISELADVIDVYYNDNNGRGVSAAVASRDSLDNFTYVGPLSQSLAAGFTTENPLEAGKEIVVTIALKMRESAGNEYQNKEIGSEFAVKLNATQAPVEADSFDKNYDLYAGKTVVNPETAQTAIHAAREGDILYLENGVYETLVIENADGSPKKGITIEHDKPGTNPTSNPFSVAHINLNSSEDITIRGIYFEPDKAVEVFNRSGSSTGYVASITGAKSGAATGAKNIVIDNCKFNGFSAAPSNYVAICFEEQGRPTSRATNITVKNCILEDTAFNFVRMNYMSEGTITIQDNIIAGGTSHSALNFTGNAADLIIRGNSFGLVSAFGGGIINKGWNTEKAMLGTSRQGSNLINIEVTGNTFNNSALVEGEGHVIELKSSYTLDNTSLVFEGNTFNAGLAGMKEHTVPCIWH